MIRKSTVEDIERIMPIYESAKRFMRRHGNMTQWTGGYPSVDVIKRDIANGNHYIALTDDGSIAFVFTFIVGADPTYATIEDGVWLNDNPYGTIHRIASSGISSGSLKEAVNYCLELIDNLRIDTHADNSPMLEGLQRLGFKRCGIIYTADGSPRVAFQKHQRRAGVRPATRV